MRPAQVPRARHPISVDALGALDIVKVEHVAGRALDGLGGVVEVPAGLDDVPAAARVRTGDDRHTIAAVVPVTVGGDRFLDDARRPVRADLDGGVGQARADPAAHAVPPELRRLRELAQVRWDVHHGALVDDGRPGCARVPGPGQPRPAGGHRVTGRGGRSRSW